MKLPRRGSASRFYVALFSFSLLYAFGSGPILATAFRLREATGRDACYLALYPYYPLVALGGRPVNAYIEWWVKLFGTVGPG